MNSSTDVTAQRRLAMILSGGGARGAYEVGVLSYIFDDFARQRGAPPRLDIVSGTSVGAINGCYLAAHLADPVLGMRRLVELWTDIELSRVLGFGVRQLVGLPRLAFGGGRTGAGLFDVRPMANLVQREISWRALSRVLRRRQLRALSVSTTEVSTGRTVVFMQTPPDQVIPTNPPPRTLFRADRIGPQHALASAAIPVLFPPVRIDKELYLDGGLRQNTPIAPALRLGATHVFAIGSSREVRGAQLSEQGAVRHERAPGLAFLLGKVLNAFLLDHVDTDIELLNRVNYMLADGTRAYGPGFTERMSAEARARGGQPYRFVKCLALHPSEDIGRMAGAFVRRGKFRGDPIVTRGMLDLLDIGVGDESDLASYLLFDGDFARQLIELGRADARARRSELLEFFGDAAEDAPLPQGDLEESGAWGASEFPAKVE
jgi:NTE family protein